MIKLERPDCPPKLVLKKDELTREYKLTKGSVWKKTFITNPLQKMSNNKCCFCECKLGEEGKYMQVEHFYPKNIYEDKVVDWNNLLPICMRCNTHKGSYDTYVNEIIDPTILNPPDHLYLSKYRLKGKDDLGKLTVKILDLNDTEEISVPRFKIADAVVNKIEEAFDLVESYNPQTGEALKEAQIIRKVRSILKQCTSKYVYSAIVSTVVLSDHLYDKLKSELVNKGIWTTDMQNLEDTAKTIKFDVKS
ncbi:HNH endonuclease [Priestia megaterium]|uniref:HNH endonuclease n=1 Tax=Priestia megaterium TaxID=1404 RepID=UPI000BF7EB03|nr:HNH endonuclease [Priestia megaterium]PFI60711.1 HNH endonuclease [Priestia megaterium]